MNSFKKQFKLSYNDNAHRQWMDKHNEWFSVVLWTERTGNILAGEKDIKRMGIDRDEIPLSCLIDFAKWLNTPADQITIRTDAISQWKKPGRHLAKHGIILEWT